MDIQQVLSSAQDVMTVRRVFGEPYEKNGVTVIPAAAVRGGGGGGSGSSGDDQEGAGGGFGVMERPVGAVVIRGDDVRWEPVVDVNRIVTVAGGVAALLVLLVARIARLRAKVQLHG